MPEWGMLSYVVHECAATTHESSIEGVTQRAEGLVTRESGLGTRIVVIQIFVESSIFIVNKP